MFYLAFLVWVYTFTNYFIPVRIIKWFILRLVKRVDNLVKKLAI